jgi:hypothetical protein
MTRILRRLQRGGALGDILILLLLLIYSPTIIFWVIVIDCVCKMRELLFSAVESRTRELVRRASIGLVIILSAPILILNTLLIAAVFWPGAWSQ